MIPTAWMDALPVTRVALRLGLPLGMDLPPDPAVAVRGALAAAVWEIVCTDEGQDCRSCRLRDGCLVPTWFAPAMVGGNRVRPFVVEVDEEARVWAVTIWLLGTLPDRALLDRAVRRMARRGVGRQRLPLALESFVVSGAEQRDVIADGAWPEPGRLSDFVEVPEWPVGAVLRLRTPTWFTGCGRRRPPTAATIARSAVMRVRSVASAEGVRVERWWPETDQLRGRWAGARYVRAQRRSGRTGDRVDLSGWVGELTLGPDVAGFADLFAALSVLHIGKNSSAGGGRLDVSWPES